ncbi:thermonuclease family protein [Lacinutrix sp. Bg11-31]|uniref:thermonuclease family protein n=1 Tax=Lacinutrix sp. Bg11-31 TaxID=2057808 RepID=UPI000C302B2F|nr:thermonuclease family protein [Lacinutrix sp. Bg11-31]AUC83578.1 nuclease [Lacinutrix sp. Bg11-31]
MYNYKAKIIAVYDGDTVTAVVDLGFLHSQEMKLRLFGIDTPEMRGAEKIEGKKVRDIVREMILDKEVEIHSYKDKQGKYGRYLATILIDGLDLNKWLVDNGHAKVYLP